MSSNVFSRAFVSSNFNVQQNNKAHISVDSYQQLLKLH